MKSVSVNSLVNRPTHSLYLAVCISRLGPAVVQLLEDEFLSKLKNWRLKYLTNEEAGWFWSPVVRPPVAVHVNVSKGDTEPNKTLLTPRCARRIAKLHRAEIECIGIDWNAGGLCIQRRFWTQRAGNRLKLSNRLQFLPLGFVLFLGRFDHLGGVRLCYNTLNNLVNWLKFEEVHFSGEFAILAMGRAATGSFV